MQRRELEELSRDELIAQAERVGVPRPRTLTQTELIDEVLSRSVRNEQERARARGFLGRARDLLARVVERGLHLPEAARALRGSTTDPWPPPPPPLPTLTLAEIYAAQGHHDRAIAVLDEVLARQPKHEGAKQLRAKLSEQARRRSRRPADPPSSSSTAAGAKNEGAPPGKRGAKGRAQSAESPAVDDAEASSPAASSSSTASQPAKSASVPAESSRQETGAVSATATSVESAARPASASEATTSDTATAPTTTAPTATAHDESTEPDAGSDSPRTPAEKADTSATGASTLADGAISPPREDAAADHEFLPERYEVDEIVGMAVDPETLYVYWEVRPTTLARARARKPWGQLILRLIAVLPTWRGPTVEGRDLHVDALFGDRFVRGIPVGANVRLSIGWFADDSFEPFAVGLEIATPRPLGAADQPPPWSDELASLPAIPGVMPSLHHARPAEWPAPPPRQAFDPSSWQHELADSSQPRAFRETGTSNPTGDHALDQGGEPRRPSQERFAPGFREPSPLSLGDTDMTLDGGASDLSRRPLELPTHGPQVDRWNPGGASELTHRRGPGQLSSPAEPPQIESWFVRAASPSSAARRES
ncbi:DUF4912 domain-containing protein [Chondromyces crocatus]|uniref:Rho termination factor N-terminal domain-containing protein n=1 Tax=Chondromyces crocatus TaxID=52 RepID=A0A0K1EPM1_CHOCO|nr:DUF4912 domain-containing protein [Chondromyces crocatus]AKT42806.1 uncharacterized protein CMC5_070330 [Chondromyces crocatus]